MRNRCTGRLWEKGIRITPRQKKAFSSILAGRKEGAMKLKLKHLHSTLIFSVLTCFLLALMGCATSSQIQALEAQTKQAMEKADKALMEAESAKAGVQDSARHSSEAEANAKRAEDAAFRAEKAARSAEASADRSEAAASKCEAALEKIMSK
jgi:hypothetical protein